MGKKKKPFWSYNRIFKITLTICIIFIFISIWLSVDVINETGTWYLFNVDFTNKSDIISAYASLLSGVLFFLSILFLILDMINQRRKTQAESLKEKKAKKRELKDRLKIISTFIEDIKKNILDQGDNLTEYYKAEERNPTLSNQCYFRINKATSTLLELDIMTTYNAFQKLKPGKEDWEKNFLNVHKILHFYNDVFPHLQENYNGQIKDKVALKNDISRHVEVFLAQFSNFHNVLAADYKSSPNAKFKEVLDFCDGFLKSYEAQIKEDKEIGDSNLTSYLRDYYEPFTKEAVTLIKKYTDFTQSISPFLQQMGHIIASVEKLEALGLNYAADLKTNTKSYFTEESEQLIKLSKIKTDIDSVID